MKRTPSLAIVILLLLSGPQVRADEQHAQFLAIKVNDQIIGYSTFEQSTAMVDGRDQIKIHAKTALKIALLGSERNTLLESDTVIDAASHGPLSYRLANTTNGTVQHVESTCADGVARTWVYQDGDERGEPIRTDLPAGVVILGGNNFGHWQMLARIVVERAGDTEAVEIPVFLPEAQRVDRLRFVKKESADLQIGEETRPCNAWELDGGDARVWLDARTAELMRMDLPAQKTSIERTDSTVVKLAEKAKAEEVLAGHFVESNVKFDDFLKVRRLEAKIDVRTIGSGPGNAASVLQTSMQTFTGKKQDDRVVGSVRIESQQVDVAASPKFPADPDKSLAEWLQPSTYIESDFPGIAAQARELTKDAATRWEAVRKIGDWVHGEIAYTIADSPSARMALEKKTGDCGPHSTLMVAMLRAVGVPARLVGGLVYTPTFGGSFGQHAWVEVHMGEPGWVAVDPTTGEFDSLSATHVKLFEGLGGVIPNSLEVLAYEPPNRQRQATKRGPAKPIPWELGREHVFRYTAGDRELGTESFVISKSERGGNVVYELKSTLKLMANANTAVDSVTRLTVKPDGTPLSFVREYTQPQATKIECVFGDGTVKETITGATNLSQTITISPDARCFDNNFMGCFVLICTQLELEVGRAVDIETFHPSTMQSIPLTITPTEVDTLMSAGKPVECFKCEVVPISNVFWISRDGRFLKVTQGDLVIELIEQRD